MEVHEVFEPAAIVYSYGLAVMGSLTSVILMDYRRQVTGKVEQRQILFLAALALGGCGIWAMHFMGMTAMKLQDNMGHFYDVSYDPIITVASLGVAIVFVFLGLEVASHDDYYGKDSEARVAELQLRMSKRKLKSVKKGGKALVEFQALYARLHWLLAGGVLAAAGVCMMHYGGMAAMDVNLERRWNWGMVALSVVIAVTAGSAAFWILFRVLEWKPHLNYLRLAAALIMGVAVCGMHYSGLYGAKYHSLPETTPHATIVSNGPEITQWAVAGSVLYCFSCMVYCYTTTLTARRTYAREVDKLFKVLARAASEQLGNLSSNPRNASSMHTSMASVGGGVNAEKERIYQFVSAALRFAIQHNSKHRNLDVDSVEQSVMQTLRERDGFGATTPLRSQRSMKRFESVSEKPERQSDPMNSTNGRRSPISPRVHPDAGPDMGTTNGASSSNDSFNETRPSNLDSRPSNLDSLPGGPPYVTNPPQGPSPVPSPVPPVGPDAV